MIVNKNSWHYILNIWMESVKEWQNYTLCKYFWLTVLSLVKLAVSTAFAVGVGILGIFLLWLLLINPILAWVTLMAGMEVGWVDYDVMYIGMVGMMLALTFIGTMETVNGRMKVVPEWINTTKKRGITPPKQPSLLLSWLKTKKDKVCPIIEFVDGEK